MAASWAEEVQDYQHDRRVKVHPDLFKGRTVGYVRGENSKRERSYNPLLGRFLDQHREREQQDFEEKVKKNYLNMARDIQLRKEAPYDLITHERKFEALVPEALDPAKPKDLKCPVPDTGVDYNIISNLRFDAHHWAHPQKRPIPKDRVPKARMVPALLHKDFNILTNRYLEHHEEKVERDRELNLLEAAEKMRQQPFNPLSQKFCDARLEERMRACQDALTTEVKLRNEEAQPLSYRGNITNCYDMLSHQVKDPELMDYIKQSEGGRKVRYKTRFRFEEDVRHADVKQEDRVKRMKPLQIAHERFTTEMERGYDILTNQDFGHRKEKHEKFLHTPRTKPLLTPWQKVLEQTGSQGHSRPRSAAGARRRTRVPGQKKEEPPTRKRRSTSRKKKKPRVAMWKSQPPRMESRTAPESQELAGENGDEDIEKELKDLINAFQMTRKKSITDFQGVPKLMKGQTAAASEQRDARDAPERSVAKEDGDGDENIQAAADLKGDEVELVLRCGIDMARFQSVWNRFENDNAIHHDDVPSALARIGFVGPEKKWVEDAFSKVTEFNGVSREEFMQVVDLYDERQRENFEEKFISCDADGSGQMDIAEFGDLLRTIGIEPMKHVLQECFDEFDEDFEAVFNKFDAFCHDEIDVQELQQVLMYVGIPTTISDCQMVAEIVDLDDSGYVDFRAAVWVSWEQEFLMCMRLFRDRELAELKNKLQALGADDSESILPCEMLNLLHSTGYVADQEVVNEVLQEIGIEAEEQIGLGSLWKFLVIFRQREGLTRAETMRVRKAFKKYASGDEGDDELIREVQTDDIPKLLRLVGYTLALEDQKQLVAQVDIDRSASLNILELKKLVRFVRERRTRDLQATINKYDRSDTGVLSEREALKALKDLGCLREELSVLPPEVLEDLQEGFLSHAAFTRSVQEYDELRRRQLIDSGGYTMEQMEQLRRQFSYYDWDDSGDVSKKELVQLIVDVFPDMAFDPDKRPLLLQIMRETDSDSNGKLDFSEFLQLMRTVEDLEQLTQLQKERSVIDETRFTSNEVSEFRNIFLAVTKGEPRMNLADFKEMMSPVCPMGDKNSHAISAMWMEICDSGSKMFDFPDFLLIMRRLLDMNFANMNQRLGRVSQRKTHQF